MKEEVRMQNAEMKVADPSHASRITHHASRYLSIYAALGKNSVAREMSFKSNFLLWIFVEPVSYTHLDVYKRQLSTLTDT